MALTHFELEIEKIKEEILKMGGLAEEAVDRAVRALVNRDAGLAREVIGSDSRINELENTIDSLCIKQIARQQPVAMDLRFLTAALRIVTILERTGDEAVNLADRAVVLSGMTQLESGAPATLLQMSELAREMTRKSLDAFVRKDIDLAYDVCCQDDELDDLNQKLLEEMINWMMQEQRLLRRGVEIILAGRHLERIGDQATNISEEVVFMVEGRVIRHQGAETCDTAATAKEAPAEGD